LQAAEKYNIDLTQSYMIGDDERDIGAAVNAGCRPIFISEKMENIILDKDVLVFSSLEDFTNAIFGQ
jgi:D-glycero-D-manno-heptose 1,7-bisphosphate phosphatase